MLELLANDELKVSARDYKHTPKHSQLGNQLEDLENEIAEKLDQEEKKLFEEYVDKQADMMSLIRAEEFIYGYQIGSLIMMDIYSILKR